MNIPNAQKWTAEIVWKHLSDMEEYASSPQCCFLGSALYRTGLHSHVWSYWRKRFKDREDILQKMLFIESMIGANLMDAGLRNVMPAKIAILTLHNHHGYRIKPAKDKDALPHQPGVPGGISYISI